VTHAWQHEGKTVVACAENLIDRPQRLLDQHARPVLRQFPLGVAKAQGNVAQPAHTNDD